MTNLHKYVVLLLGGGIDSTALIPFYRSRGAEIQGIHFDYGQPSFAGEQRALRAICDHYSVPLITVNLGAALLCHNGEYRGRNGLFLLLAASIIPETRTLAIGIHAGVTYYDSSKHFIDDVQRMFDGYFAGLTRVEAPFVGFSKHDVYQYGIQSDVPFDLTFSCERASDEPCQECPSCLDRAALFETT